jgi:hypothetical protein
LRAEVDLTDMLNISSQTHIRVSDQRVAPRPVGVEFSRFRPAKMVEDALTQQIEQAGGRGYGGRRIGRRSEHEDHPETKVLFRSKE